LKSLYGIDDIDSRIKIAEEMLDTIEKIDNYMVKSEYIKILAKNIGFEEQVLWSQMGIRKKSNIGSLIKNTSFRKLKYGPAEKTLTLIMIEIPESIPKIMNHLELNDIPTSEIRKIISKILQVYPNLEKLKVANFLNYLNDEEKKVLTEILAEEHELDRNILDTIIEDCIEKLQQLKLKKYREYLTQEIKKAQESNDEIKVMELITKLNEALNLKSTLNSGGGI
jgi:DNA primase